MVFSDLGFLDKLLSTSDDRALYEALWLVSITSNHRVENSKFDFNKVKVHDICNSLIAQWRKRDQRRKGFYMSSQLFIGTVYVYQFQVQALYDQAQTALRSCRLAFYDANWIASQVPMSQSQSTPNPESQKKRTKKVAGKSKKNIESQLQETQNDFDIIEEFFKVVDDEDGTETVSLNPRKKGRDDSGFDPTMASDLGAITLLDPRTMTSGFNTMDMEIDDDDMLGFGTETGAVDFQHQILDSDQNVPERLDGERIKKPLVYDSVEDIDLCIRDAASQYQNDFPDIAPDFNIPENLTNYAEDETMPPPPKPIETPESSAINNAEMQQESEIVLPVIKVAPKKRKRNRKLIIDNVTKLELKVLKESSDYYEKKIKLKPPRDTWDERVEEMKKHIDIVCAAPARLRQSAPLRGLFERNLKKIPERLNKKRKQEVEPGDDEIDKENGGGYKENEGKKRRKTLRKRDNALKDLNEENILNRTFAMDMPEYTPQLELEIPTDYHHVPEALTPPVQINNEDQSNISSIDHIVLSKKDIMIKLKQFWKEKDETITMTKLCAGLSRISSARVFFELMALSKANHIELVHKEGNLEIGNIKSKLTGNQISKIYK